MNTLETWIALNELDHNTTMNQLTEEGLISDNAVMAKDVAEPDASRARDWLAEQE